MNQAEFRESVMPLVRLVKYRDVFTEHNLTEITEAIQEITDRYCQDQPVVGIESVCAMKARK